MKLSNQKTDLGIKNYGMEFFKHMEITQEQYNKLRQKGLNERTIQSIAQKRGYELPGQPRIGAVQSFGVGVVKGGLSTLRGAGQLGTTILNKATGQDRGSDIYNPETETGKKVVEALKPEGLAQQLGYGVEKIAEFLAPSSKIAGLSKAFNAPTRAVVEGVATGGQVAVQQGEVDNTAKTAALVAAAFPILGAGFKAITGATGKKIQETVIRATARDMEDGFKIENVNKYGVGGALKDTVAKTHTKMNELTQQLSEKLRGSSTALNLNEVYAKTVKKLLQDKGRSFGDVASIKNIAENQLLNEIKEQAGDNGLVNLVEATNIKRGAGTKGAWSYNRPEPDASAIEKVYTTFYNEIKNEIERLAPEGVKEINKQLSELIPISNAALRRLPVEQRNNILSLTDSIGLFASVFDPKALALIGANKLSKSGTFGNFLANLGQQPKTSVSQRILGSGKNAVPEPIGGLSMKDVSGVKDVLLNQRDEVAKKLRSLTSKSFDNSKGKLNLDLFGEAEDLMKLIEKGKDTPEDIRRGMELLRLLRD